MSNIFYKNAFASTYKYYSKFKKEAPLGSAICVLAVSQSTLTLLLLLIVIKITKTNVTFLFPYRYFSILVIFSWMYLLYRYYTKERTLDIIESFNKKSPDERRLWAIAAFLAFLLPSILIFIVLIKWR